MEPRFAHWSLIKQSILKKFTVLKPNWSYYYQAILRSTRRNTAESRETLFQFSYRQKSLSRVSLASLVSLHTYSTPSNKNLEQLMTCSTSDGCLAIGRWISFGARCGLFLAEPEGRNGDRQVAPSAMRKMHFYSWVLSTRLVTATMSTVLPRRILSLPRSYARLYTTNNKLPESPPQRVTPEPRHPPTEPQRQRHKAHVTPRQSPPHPPTQPETRHEAQEGTTALNVPYNPPGGGPGGNTPGGGGGGAYTFTKSPILDAILATALGLGAGNGIAQHIWLILLKYFSFRWRCRLRQMVQDGRLE